MLPPASSVLTNPGPLCTGQTATLTCNITGGTRISWIYNVRGSVETIPTFNPNAGISPPTEPVTVNGVEFTVSVLMPTSPHLVSIISFVASAMTNGGILACIGFSSAQVEEEVTLQVESFSELENTSLAKLVMFIA